MAVKNRMLGGGSLWRVDGTLNIRVSEGGSLQIDGVSATALITGATSGATQSAMLLAPTASAVTANVNYHKLLAIGDVTGNTAYGFGDPAKPTTGLMASFGRTVATSGALTDTGLDVRAINKLVNVGANTLQGAYVKAKNYTGGTVGGDLVGLFVEVINDGTLGGKAIGLKLGKDSGAMTADIQFTNGTYFVASTAAITPNVTTTTAPIDSFTIQGGKLFVSDGSKWQYAVVTG